MDAHRQTMSFMFAQVRAAAHADQPSRGQFGRSRPFRRDRRSLLHLSELRVHGRASVADFAHFLPAITVGDPAMDARLCLQLARCGRGQVPDTGPN